MNAILAYHKISISKISIKRMSSLILKHQERNGGFESFQWKSVSGSVKNAAWLCCWFSAKALTALFVLAEESLWDQPVTWELLSHTDTASVFTLLSFLFYFFFIAPSVAASIISRKFTKRRTTWWRLWEVSPEHFDLICCSKVKGFSNIGCCDVLIV